MNKKTILYCALAFALASCGGKKTSGEEAVAEDSAPHSELNLSPELISHLDSIAGIISSTASNVDFKALVENGKFSLTDQQKKVKPHISPEEWQDHLYHPSKGDNRASPSSADP